MLKRTLQECYHQGRGNLTAPDRFTINHQFNRMEHIDHAYRVFHGTEPLGNSFYQAVIKCKLVYSKNYELITPDLIYIKTGKNKFKWFQFYNFIPGLFDRDDNFKFYLPVNISGGHRIKISFSSKDLIKKLPDNSQLFNCKVQGPKNIREYATGKGKLIDGIPFIVEGSVPGFVVPLPSVLSSRIATLRLTNGSKSLS